MIALRLASVCADDRMPAPARVGPPRPWGLGGITILAAWVAEPVADILGAWWGQDVDLSHFRRKGHEFDAVYDVRRIREELGFVAQRLCEHNGKLAR